MKVFTPTLAINRDHIDDLVTDCGLKPSMPLVGFDPNKVNILGAPTC